MTESSSNEEKENIVMKAKKGGSEPGVNEITRTAHQASVTRDRLNKKAKPQQQAQSSRDLHEDDPLGRLFGTQMS